MPLVRQFARRYAQFNPDYTEDLVQVGSIGLLKAIKYYDPRRARSAQLQNSRHLLHQGRDSPLFA